MKMSTRGQTKDVKIAEDWKRAQDQPQYAHLDNRCLNCEGNHKTRDCPMRQQHQAPPANNPVSSTGTNFQYSLHFQQTPPQQHLQQSQSTVGSSTLMLMVNNHNINKVNPRDNHLHWYNGLTSK